MLKLLLCIVIIFCGAVIGLHLSQRLIRRRNLLQRFEAMLYRAMTYIAYSEGCLYEVFSDEESGTVFQPDIPFTDQWERLILSHKYILTQRDIALLLDFSKGLGTADVQAQQRHIMLYIKLLQEQTADAQEEIQSKSKIVRLLPLSAGIVLSLLLI